MYQPYEYLLTTLATEIGLDPASLVATEEIIIDELPIGLHLVGEGEQAEVVLCSLLSAPTADRWAEVAANLLHANHMWTGTGGGTLGMLPGDFAVSLSVRRLLRDLDAEKLAVLLAKTADVGQAWEDYITSSISRTDAPAYFEAADNLRA